MARFPLWLTPSRAASLEAKMEVSVKCCAQGREASNMEVSVKWKGGGEAHTRSVSSGALGPGGECSIRATSCLQARLLTVVISTPTLA